MPVKAVTPGGGEIEIAEVVVSQPLMAQGAAGNSFPKTASLVPLWGLLGMLSLVASFVLRLVSRNLA